MSGQVSLWGCKLPHLLLRGRTKPTPLASATGPSDFQAVSCQECGWAAGRIPAQQLDAIDCNPEFFFLNGCFGWWYPGAPCPHTSFLLTVIHQENKARRGGRWGVAEASLCQIQLSVEREVGLERGEKSSHFQSCVTPLNSG